MGGDGRLMPAHVNSRSIPYLHVHRHHDLVARGGSDPECRPSCAATSSHKPRLVLVALTRCVSRSWCPRPASTVCDPRPSRYPAIRPGPGVEPRCGAARRCRYPCARLARSRPRQAAEPSAAPVWPPRLHRHDRRRPTPEADSRSGVAEPSLRSGQEAGQEAVRPRDGAQCRDAPTSPRAAPTIVPARSRRKRPPQSR